MRELLKILLYFSPQGELMQYTNG